MLYIVPEYYKDFRCKCSECRHSCCDGWPIRISMKEYYYLLGITCSDNLRAKLDCALKKSLEPSKECYALVSTNWQGLCMLHREDGLCALQAELGESSLPAVCRLYPRNTKQLTEMNQCSCSNSCEEVIELLNNFKEPMRFLEVDLSINPTFEINLPPQKYEYCNKSISILQDRSLTLPERFLTLGNFLYGKDIYKIKPTNLSIAFQIINVLNKYYENNISISDYCKETQCYFGMDGDEKLSEEALNMIEEKYVSASAHLESILPNWQILFEQMIVNHMFYNNFPYTNNQENMNDSFLSLTMIYTFLRFNLIGYMSNKAYSEKFIDFLAAMFRLIEHSNFNHVIVSLFKKENYQMPDCITQLIYI